MTCNHELFQAMKQMQKGKNRNNYTSMKETEKSLCQTIEKNPKQNFTTTSMRNVLTKIKYFGKL